MATVLVPGGAGYIGTFTCRALLSAGHRAIAYDNLSTGHRELAQGELIVGDIRDGTLARSVLRENKVEAVIHFAACIEARESVANPAKFYENNVGGLIAFLNACRDTGVKAFVFSSSCATYGVPQYVPIDENHPQSPISPYGRTKLIGEWLLRDYAAAYGIRYAALRYFNAAGGDNDGRLGEWHQPESHLIPLAIEAAVSGRPLRIFGTNHPTPDGTCIRDYIHVEDLARAHVLAIERLLAGGPSLELNLGTGRGHSVREVVAAVGRVLGRQVPIVEVEAQPGDQPQLVANASRARDILGFVCRRPDLDDIVASAWAFLKTLPSRRAAGTT
ncbi:MAG: UDP-glucose 4-epimerase GalE [Candidatus Sumerlaeia bacterium]|nr:UDP-glucose 4-epimerase GalE [Candidatus Sumerlaeia bacterium]